MNTPETTTVEIVWQGMSTCDISINNTLFNRSNNKHTSASWKELSGSDWINIYDLTRIGELESIFQQHKNKEA